MDNKVKTKFQVARDPELTLRSVNPRLLDGEVIISTSIDGDKNKTGIKVGDGKSLFKSLPYYSEPDKLDKSKLDKPNGAATLDNFGKVKVSQLPEEYVKKILDTLKSYTIPPDVGSSISYLPRQSGTLTYNGNEQTPVWNNYDPDLLEISGITKATAAGKYTASFTPKGTFKWVDNTRNTKFVEWSINKRVVNVPTVANPDIAYTGKPQTVRLNDADPKYVTLGSMLTGTTAGNYVISVSLNESCVWADGTNTPKYINWELNRKTIQLPVIANGPFTYNETEQTVAFNNYDTDICYLFGKISATDAGSYDVKFRLKDTVNYQWADGTTNDQNVTWKINKAKASVETVPNRIIIVGTGVAKTRKITVNTVPSDGSFSIGDYDATIVNASIVDEKLTIQPNGLGSTTVVISSPATTNNNYIEASADIPVTVKQIADLTLPEFDFCIKQGNVSNMFAVGDAILTPVSGTCINAVFSDVQIYSQILGINHNLLAETPNATTSVHMAMGKMNNVPVCFVDPYPSAVPTTPDFTGFVMNPKGSTQFPSSDSRYSNGFNDGGWEACYMRNTVLREFFNNCIPEESRKVIKQVIKYTDNVGGIPTVPNGAASNVTSTTDNLFLIAEFEVFGARTSANINEQNYQKQYDFYKNSVAKYRYRHNSTGSGQPWWFRSLYAANSSNYYFCVGSTSSSSSYSYASYSYGMTPCYVLTDE